MTRERVRQLGLRALPQLTAPARFQGWAGQMYELEQTPRAVVVPLGIEEA